MTVLLVSYTKGLMSRVSEEAKPLSLKKIWGRVLLRKMLMRSILPHYTNVNSRMHNMKISSKYELPVSSATEIHPVSSDAGANLLYRSSAHTHNLHFLVTIRIAQTMQIFQNSLFKIDSLLPTPLLSAFHTNLWVIMLLLPESESYSFKTFYVCMQTKLAIFLGNHKTWVLSHYSPR